LAGGYWLLAVGCWLFFRDALRARKLRAEAKINIRNKSPEHLFTHAEQFGKAKLKAVHKQS
jgi:hypothetical protein